MNIPEEAWMRSMKNESYGDEIFNEHGSPVGHPHFMKCVELNNISRENRDKFWGLSEFTGSMLHGETLALVNYFASISTGTILEIGAFTGGATVSAGLGLTERSENKSTIISIEAGSKMGEWIADPGAMADSWRAKYPTGLPSKEIFSILNNNIKTYNLEERVDLVEGRSGDVDVLEKITPTLEKEPIGLLIIDADGNVARDLNIYLQYVRKGGYLVIDDYVMRSHYKGIADKATQAQETIHGLVNYGVARSLGVYPWGTWFGQKL